MGAISFIIFNFKLIELEYYTITLFKNQLKFLRIHTHLWQIETTTIRTDTAVPQAMEITTPAMTITTIMAARNTIKGRGKEMGADSSPFLHRRITILIGVEIGCAAMTKIIQE